ncbi:D-tyrosyl-tRNA(Tyr) deacylase [Xanthoria parietina]
MKAILQRVASASVTVDAQLISSIGKGVLVFAAVAPDDTPKEVESMAAKVLKMKMWPDDAGGTWKRNVQDINGEVLCISQFTLLASTKKGSKPDFHGAAGGEQARELYDHFVTKVEGMYEKEKVKNGVFQAMMQVNLQNDGPVSVDYQSYDAEVTLEIQTHPSSAQDKGKSKTDAKAGGESEYQLPAELLE